MKLIDFGLAADLSQYPTREEVNATDLLLYFTMRKILNYQLLMKFFLDDMNKYYHSSNIVGIYNNNNNNENLCRHGCWAHLFGYPLRWCDRARTLLRQTYGELEKMKYSDSHGKEKKEKKRKRMRMRGRWRRGG